MLRVEQADAYYGKFHVIKNVSLKVNAREIVSILGANGAGKTSLLKTICGLIPVRTGSISFMDKEISTKSVEQIISSGICLVPEGRSIFTEMSVLENLEIGAYCRFKKNERMEIRRDMETVLNLFPILRNRLNQRAGTLSGGEQQMLAMARGLMSNPKLMLLDEPTLGLAPLIVKLIYEVIRELRGKDLTILLVEQNCKIALSVSDRAYVMQTGRIVLEDTAPNLLRNEEVQVFYLGMAKEP